MRTRWLARALLPRLQRLAASREPDFQIKKTSGGGEGEDVYLRRWWLIPRNRLLGVYLHNMVRDDDAVRHDHPYLSLSLCLSSGLLESYQEFPPSGVVRMRKPQQGQWIWRSSRMAHQLMVMSPAWTLFFTGPRIREWGFWCPRGWRSWRQYVATSGAVEGGGTSGVGAGCGED